MTEEQFWHSNPRLMKPYIQAWKQQSEEEMQRSNIFAYIQGVYFRDAIVSTIGNMFSDKNSKKNEYPSEPYPFFKPKEAERELTEEEKIEQTKLLFAKLNVMKSNFDLASS